MCESVRSTILKFPKTIPKTRNGLYNPSVFWQKDNAEVAYDERVSKLADNSILIKHFEPRDSGSWMVTAYNSVGKIARKQITLNITPTVIPIKVSRTSFTASVFT